MRQVFSRQQIHSQKREAHLDNCASDWVKSLIITSRSFKRTFGAKRSEDSSCPILFTVIGWGWFAFEKPPGAMKHIRRNSQTCSTACPICIISLTPSIFPFTQPSSPRTLAPSTHYPFPMLSPVVYSSGNASREEVAWRKLGGDGVKRGLEAQ